jgi:hypothetical protein
MKIHGLASLSEGVGFRILTGGVPKVDRLLQIAGRDLLLEIGIVIQLSGLRLF